MTRAISAALIGLAMTLGCLGSAWAAEVAVVQGNGLNLRETPPPNPEVRATGTIIRQARSGERFVVVTRDGASGWYQVRDGERTAWLSDKLVTIEPAPDPDTGFSMSVVHWIIVAAVAAGAFFLFRRSRRTGPAPDMAPSVASHASSAPQPPPTSSASALPTSLEYADLPIRVLHRNSDGVPTTVFVRRRFDQDPVLAGDDMPLQMFLATSFRIYAWVDVVVGGVSFRDVLALMSSGLRSPQLEAKPPIPVHLRHDEVTTPPGDVFRKIHLVADAELDAAPKKYVRPGLWFSASMAQADTLVSHGQRLYIIPAGGTGQLVRDLARDGEQVFARYESFPDPTAAITDEEIILDGRAYAELPWVKAQSASPAGVPRGGGEFLAGLSREDRSVVSNLDPAVYEAVITAREAGYGSVSLQSPDPRVEAAGTILWGLDVADLTRLAESVRCTMRGDEAARTDVAQAAALYLKACELNPHDDVALMSYGVALTQQGQVREGMAWLERAVAANPNSERARRNLEALKSYL